MLVYQLFLQLYYICFRIANQRVLELESQAEEREEGGGAGLQQCIVPLQEKLRETQSERDRLSTQVEELLISINDYSEDIFMNKMMK